MGEELFFVKMNMYLFDNEIYMNYGKISYVKLPIV